MISGRSFMKVFELPPTPSTVSTDSMPTSWRAM